MRTTRIQPLTVARAVQLMLVAVIVIAAVLTAPENRSEGPVELLNRDERVADFADAAVEALGSLQGQPLGSGFLGTDRGELFASGGANYERSIAEVLVEADLLDADEARAFAAEGIRFLAHQCGQRLGVLVTSSIEVPAERRAWWDDNGCDAGLVTFLQWPVYIALGESVDGAP